VKHEELLDRVKQAVHQIEPEVEIILYGSRARGDAHAESDWDFLILLHGKVDDGRTDRVRHRLYDLEWACGEVLPQFNEYLASP
jgi:predicted nucleotidyltransferase